MLSNVQIIERLESIEADLAARQEPGAKSAEDYHRAKRDFEKSWAEEYLKTEGTVKEREQQTILALYGSKAYKEMVVAEAAYEGWKAAYRTLDTRASIGQSLLKAWQREPIVHPDAPKPQWSHSERAAVGA